MSDDPLSHASDDGRQSPAAAAIQRGTGRLLVNMGFAPLTELPLKTGRRTDITAINAKGEILIVEIKSSLADFRADTKWQDYLDHCDRFFFAVAGDFPLDVLPEGAHVGIIIADKYGAEVLREAETDRLSAARRKAVTLTFARVSAARVHRTLDPGIAAQLAQTEDGQET